MAQKVIRASASTNAFTGEVTVSIKVPGTFMGIDFKLPTFQGRQPSMFGFFFASPTPGDICSALVVEDTDLLVQNAIGQGQAEALFPAYPVINTFSEASVAASNQGFFIPPIGPFQMAPPNGGKFIPSGFYLKGTFKKASVVVDTIFINILWDDLT